MSSNKRNGLHWIDNADSYKCPVCGYETVSPAKLPGCICPVCGFQDEKDKDPEEEKDPEIIMQKGVTLKICPWDTDLQIHYEVNRKTAAAIMDVLDRYKDIPKGYVQHLGGGYYEDVEEKVKDGNVGEYKEETKEKGTCKGCACGGGCVHPGADDVQLPGHQGT